MSHKASIFLITKTPIGRNVTQFGSVQSLDLLGRHGDVMDDSAEILSPVFSAGGHREQFRHEQECPLFNFVHPELLLSIVASTTLRGALKDDSEEAVVTRPVIHQATNRQEIKKNFSPGI